MTQTQFQKQQSDPIYCGFPRAGYLAHKEEIDRAIQKVCQQGNYILGEECRLFEEEFSRFIGVVGGVGVANGTDSLMLIIKALGLNENDEVLTVSHTAVATVTAIRNVQVGVGVCDVEEQTYLLDIESCKKMITERTKAVILVHLYGRAAPMDAWVVFCQEHGLYLIEDCAQAHGVYWKGQRVGSFGIASSFSFYPTKNLGALGDGGMVCSNDLALLERVRMLRQYGWKERYYSQIEGFNSRLDELQAAVLRVKLPYLDEDNRKRILLAQHYRELLKDIEGITLPTVEERLGEHVHHLFVIRLSSQEQRDWLQIQLKEKYQIHCIVHYPLPIHKQEAYTSLFPDLDLPITQRLSQEVLSLPLYPELSLEKVIYVCQAIRRELCGG